MSRGRFATSTRITFPNCVLLEASRVGAAQLAGGHEYRLFTWPSQDSKISHSRSKVRIGSCTTRLPILTRANVPILIQWEYQFRTKLSLELLAEATRFRRRNTFVSNRKPRPNRNSLFALIKSHSCCARIDSLQPAPSNAPQHLRPGMIWPKNPFLGAHRTGENRRGPAPFCEPTKKRPGQDPHLVKATTAHYCPQLTLEKPVRLPMANDLASQKTDSPPLPVMMLGPPPKSLKSAMEIHRRWTPSPELLEIVAPFE